MPMHSRIMHGIHPGIRATDLHNQALHDPADPVFPGGMGQCQALQGGGDVPPTNFPTKRPFHGETGSGIRFLRKPFSGPLTQVEIKKKGATD